MRFDKICAAIFLLAVTSIQAADYTSIDIGTQIQGSTVDNGGGSFSVTASGSDMWDSSDSMRLISKSFSGDFDVRAQVTGISSASGVDGWAKAGITIRDSADPGSIHASVIKSFGNGIRLQHRDSTNGGSADQNLGWIDFPNAWVRMIRSGGTITALISSDNLVWYAAGSLTWNGGDNVQVGMAVTAHNGSATCDAEFQNVSIQAYTPPTPGSGTGLAGDYFGNTELSGAPLLSRIDSQINLDLNGAGPGGAVPAYNFSARWLGQVQAQYSEIYSFYTESDDGVRLWVDGKLLIDNWNYHGPTENAGTILLAAGQKYDVQAEFFQGGGGARARLSWSSPSTPKTLVPQSQLYATGNTRAGDGVGLAGAYFNSKNLSVALPPNDIPALNRIDPSVNFDWSWGGSPDPSVNNSNFSARWTGTVLAEYTETYTLYVTADDGARLWVNNQLMIDAWYDQGATTYTANVNLSAGQKAGIRLEYYQGGGGATVKLEWSSPSRPRGVIQQNQLYIDNGINPVIGSGDGLSGAYFNNTAVAGNAVFNRVDPKVNFDWSNISPGAGVNGYDFSVRWVGQIQAQFSEQYTFSTISDDGIRVWLDGNLIVDNWTYHGAAENVAAVALVAGQKYDLQIEYFQGGYGAVAQLIWSSPSTPKEIVPQSQLYSTGNTRVGSGTGLLAQYFNAPDLSSPVSPFNVPVLTRFDGPIDFDWSTVSPDPTNVNQSNFSARWIGQIQAQYSETYTFYVTADDGVRLWVNNQLLVDGWVDQAATTYTGTISLTAGQKAGIKMEYYQRYGGAMARLEWSSPSRPRTDVPASQLYSASGIAAPIPATSVVSPAFVEGISWSPDGSPYTIAASSPGANVGGTMISDNNWFVNLPLNSSGGATPVFISQSATNGTASGSIVWIPLDLAGSEASEHNIVIRKGDSLLLTANGNGQILMIDADGDGVADFVGVPGQTFPFKYDAAGTYIAQATINGVLAGTLVVTVMDADMQTRIADEVVFQRQYNVPITPDTSAQIIVFESADSVSLRVDNTASNTSPAIVSLSALKRGMPMLVARLKTGGPIIAIKRVSEFTLDTQALRGALVNDSTNIGGTILNMRPYIPNVRLQFDLFAHTSTFAGGATSLSFNTSDIDPSTDQPLMKQVYDPDTHEYIGQYFLELQVPPGEDKYCFNVHAFDGAGSGGGGGIAVSREAGSGGGTQIVAQNTNINGCVCHATVSPVTVCKNESGSFSVGLMLDDKTTTHDCSGPFLIDVQSTGVTFTDPSEDRTMYCGESESFEIEGLQYGTYPVHVGGVGFSDSVTVLEVNITPVSKVVCVNSSVTFTASAFPDSSAGSFSWSAPDGDPATGGNQSTFTTTFSYSGLNLPVTVTYSQNGHSCTAVATVTVVQVAYIDHPIVCVGDPLTFNATPTPGNSFPDNGPDWEQLNPPGPKGSGQQFTATLNDPKYIGMVSVRARCGASDSWTDADGEIVGVKSIEQTDPKTNPICVHTPVRFQAASTGSAFGGELIWDIVEGDATVENTGEGSALVIPMTGGHIIVRARCSDSDDGARVGFDAVELTSIVLLDALDNGNSSPNELILCQKKDEAVSFQIDGTCAPEDADKSKFLYRVDGTGVSAGSETGNLSNAVVTLTPGDRHFFVSVGCDKNNNGVLDAEEEEFHADVYVVHAEIQINNTPDKGDNLVMFNYLGHGYCGNLRPTTLCRVRLLGAPRKLPVLLTSETCDFLVNDILQGTENLSVDTEFLPFEITGEVESVRLNDSSIDAAIIRNGLNADCGFEDLTVYFLDSPKITLGPGGIYAVITALDGTLSYTSTTGRAVTFSTSMSVGPAGINTNASPVAMYQMGQKQTMLAAKSIIFYSNPSIVWTDSAPHNYDIVESETYEKTINVELPIDDALTESDLPLYELAAGVGLNAGPSNSGDRPYFEKTAPLYAKIISLNDVQIAKITYRRITFNINYDFSTYAVVAEIFGKAFIALRQAEWGLHANSDIANESADILSNDHSVDTCPTIGPPIFNTANTQSPLIGSAAKVTFHHN